MFACCTPHVDKTQGSQSARSVSSDERIQEKERLQNMVKEFAKNLVRGQVCEAIYKTDNGFALADAKYCLTRTLSQMKIEPLQEKPANAACTFNVSDIIDIVKNTEETNLMECLCDENISPQLPGRFVCIIIIDNGGYNRYCGLLLPNQFERDRFLTCMKILRWAMDFRRSEH
eukprot:GEMP01063801.1.p1 GENE.GEMP01063801.1~~GEMP01063801.1.p1  ORF type:complete len:173 (+),score=33.39 GEMP01063801.1:214-732(+)